MRRGSRFAPVAGITAAALMLATAVAIAPAHAATTTVLSSGFEDGSTTPWQGRGDASIAITTTDARTGTTSLAVTGSTATWHGVETNVLALLQPGVEYEITAYVKLPAGAPPTTAGFTMQIMGATEEYEQVGGRPAVTADGWTQVGGRYTLPAGQTSANLYLEAATITDFYVDDILITAEEGGGGVGTEFPLEYDFEDGTQGWTPRDNGTGAPLVEQSTDYAEGGGHALRISERTSQGSGARIEITDLLDAGVTYELTARVRFAEDEATDAVWLSVQRGESTFDTLGQFAAVTSTGWTTVTESFTLSAFDQGWLYFETAWDNGETGNTSTFYVDDVRISVPEQPEIEDLLPLKDTFDVPVGVAVDQREFTGPASALTRLHFDQLTSENYMKPEYFYSAPWEFRVHPEAAALMDYASTHDLGVYGHVLVWHSQTPDWFFQREPGGAFLTDSPADQELLRDRLRTHIFNVADALSAWGDYGDDNPIVAWDVVNEVVADGGEFADGLRRSRWYDILGEEFIDLAFRYADEAFNRGEHTAAGADRPITLFINDYNTEQSGKQSRYAALVDRLLERGAPLDGVGHQFHLNLAVPNAALRSAFERFDGLGLVQAVTEFDVTTGTPVTPALLIDQGYYYRDAFRLFREYEDQLFSVTVWGLTDNRSWRSGSGDPLVFDSRFQAKPAYWGAIDGDLPAPLRTANVFGGDVAEGPGAVDDIAWRQLRLRPIDSAASFQLRWSDDRLVAYVSVDDPTQTAGDGIAFQVGDDVVTVPRTDPRVVARAGGYHAVVALPIGARSIGDTVEFDVRATDGTTTTGWNTPGVLGTLTLVEPLGYVEVAAAAQAPAVDGVIDDVWEAAASVRTETFTSGSGGATATVRTLWRGGTLYVLAEVDDPIVDVTGSDPWVQDSVEIYVDAGNYKNGSYRYDDTQIRISAQNVVSFGAGDETFQRNRVQSSTATTDGGYLVEAAISLLEEGGAGTFHGLDFQVNDASGGQRTSISNWADPTGLGYQSTARWGVGRLLPAGGGPGDPVLDLGASDVGPGGTVEFVLEGLEPGAEIEIFLVPEDWSGTFPPAPTTFSTFSTLSAFSTSSAPAALRTLAAPSIVFPLSLGTFAADGSGRVADRVTIPADLPPGAYRLLAVLVADGSILAQQPLAVAALPGAAPGFLGDTGRAGTLGTAVLALLLLLVGVAARASRRTASRA